MKDATYATSISLRIEILEGKHEEVDNTEQHEEFEAYDPWVGVPVIPACTINDSHINQIWFPPSPKELDDGEATPRSPNDLDKRRSDSCPPSRSNRRKPSLPPVFKVAQGTSRPSSSRPS